MRAQEELVFNGIVVETGDYLLSPRSPRKLAETFRGMTPPAVHRAVLPQFDAEDLAVVGWGAIFPREASQAVREALSPLFQRRREQAGDRYRDDLVYRGEDYASFLKNNDADLGAVDPRRLPYYLLLIGGPDEIPFEFQHLLDVQHAVGRLSFETAEEYAHYAAGVLASESGEVEKPRRMELFGVRNWDDLNTELCERHLVDPLARRLSGHEGWVIGTTRREDACKAKLAELLGGEEAPAILLTASHGVAFQTRDKSQLEDQGALVCYEWPGPKSWRGRLEKQHYFAARDVSKNADLRGSIAFLFGCFSAGTPRRDTFSRHAGSKIPDNAPVDFLGALPRRLLAHPKGGALAVVGHIDQAWPNPFRSRGAGSRIGHIESIFREWMSGRPAGLALDVLAQRHATVAAILTETAEQRRRAGPDWDAKEDAYQWMEYHDARSYVLLGDPAVCLPKRQEPPTVSKDRTDGPSPRSEVDLTRPLPRISANQRVEKKPEVPASPSSAALDAAASDAGSPSKNGAGFRRSIAAVIGIDLYEHGIPALHNARRDAEAVAEVLRDLHGYSVLPPLTEKVGKPQLLGFFENLGEQVGEEDRLLVYFAGHGLVDPGSPGLEGYLVPQDAQPGGERDRQLVSMTTLKECLLKLPCRHLLLVLDCCFAGAFRGSQFRSLDFVLNDRVFREQYDCFVRDPAWQILTSAAHDQKAHDALWGLGERGGSLHSPFAAALIEGLRGAADLVPTGGDGLITVTELYLYLRRKIETPTHRQGERQTPGLWNLRGNGEFVFTTPGRELDLEPAPVLSLDVAPYRGLASFDEEHAEFFFGREDSVAELTRRVGEKPLTVIVGASGTGKSSLLKAGLIPALRSRGGDWRIVELARPGVAPWDVVAEALPSVPDQDWRSDPLETLSSWLRGSPKSSILLAIDSFEEVSAQNDVATARHFESLLAALLVRQDQMTRDTSESPVRLRVVLVLRSDAEPLFANGPLADRWREARWPMPPLGIRDLRRAILGPAHRWLLLFEEKLVEILVEEVSGMPGALPLLSFTLDQLYRAYLESGRTDRTLTRSDYEQLGRVAGSLRGQAEKLYSALEEPALRSTLERVLLRMVDLEASGPIRRQVSRRELDSEDLAENRRVDEVLRRLVESRLLVRDGEFLEPAHGSLLMAWDRLRRWIESSAEDLLLRRRLSQATQDWQAGHGALWMEEPRLTHLWVGPGRTASWLNQDEARFARASQRRRRWRCWRRAGLLIAAAVLLVTGFTTLRRQEGEKQLLHSRVLSEKLAAKARAIAAEGPGTDSQLALLLARQAYNFAQLDSASRRDHGITRALRDALDKALAGGLVYGALDKDQKTPTALSPDASQLAIGLGSQSLQLDLESLEEYSRPWPAGVGRALAVAWHHEGELWVSGHETGHLCWCHAEDEAGRGIACLASGVRQSIVALSFAPWANGHLLGISKTPNGGRLDRWALDLETSEARRLSPLSGWSLATAPVALALSPAGEAFIAFAGKTGVARFAVKDEGAPNPLPDLPGYHVPRQLATRADGMALAGVAEDGTLLQWYPDFPGESLTLDEIVKTIAFDPLEEGFMTTDHQGVLIWRSGLFDTSPRRFASFCDGTVDEIAFSADGKALAVTCDSAVRVWNRGEPAWAVTPDGSADDLALRACRIVRRDLSKSEWTRHADAPPPVPSTCSPQEEPGN